MAAKFYDFKSTDKSLTFTISGLDTSIVNGLRRTLLTDIPTVVICFIPNQPDSTLINFIKNTTNLSNEFIGHRISMIPLGFNRQELRYFQSSNYRFELNETNDTDKPRSITTEHIKIYDQTGKIYPPDVHDHIFMKNRITGSKILITKLLPGHQLHFEATPQMGTAREWAGWSPVSLSTYMFVVDEVAAKKAEEEYVETKKVEGANNIDDLRSDFKNLERYRYFKKDKDGDPLEFEFSLETECGMSCIDLVDNAFEVMSTNLEKVFNGTYDIMTQDNTIQVNRINHTLGHMIMWYLYEMKNDVSYVGYNMPHPLEEVCTFKIMPKTTGIDILELFKKSVQELKKYVDDVRDKWKTSSVMKDDDIVTKTVQRKARSKSAK